MRQTSESRLVLLQIWLPFQETHLKNGNFTVTQFTLYIKWKQTDCSGKAKWFLLLSREMHFSWEFLNCFMWWMPSSISWQWSLDEVLQRPSQHYTKVEFCKSSSMNVKRWDSDTEFFACLLEFRDGFQRSWEKRGIAHASGPPSFCFSQLSFDKHCTAMSNEFQFYIMARTYLKKLFWVAN